jgi:hypothetical protein
MRRTFQVDAPVQTSRRVPSPLTTQTGVEACADRVYAELPVPEAKADCWAELVALARSMRRALLRHPSALTLRLAGMRS